MHRFLLIILLFINTLCLGQSDLQTLYDSALKSENFELVKKVNEIAAEQNNKKLLGHSYYLMAFLQKKEDKFYEAVSNYFEALVVYREIDDQEQIANVTENIANIYYLTGFYDTALKYYYDALSIQLALNSTESLVDINSSISLQLHELGRNEDALNHYNSTIEAATKIQDSSRLYWIYNNLGRLHREMKKYALAEESYRKALSFSSNTHQEAGIYNNIGYLHLILHDTLSAFENLKLALKLIKDNPSINSFTGTVYSNLASIYDGEKLDSAHWFYRKSYEFLKKYPMRMSGQYFSVCKKLKELSQEQGNLKLALTYSEDIDKLTTDLLALREQLNGLYNRYQVEAATYKFQHQEKAKALEQQLVVDHYIKIALTAVILILILVSIILYRSNRKIRFARNTARKIYQVINS